MVVVAPVAAVVIRDLVAMLKAPPEIIPRARRKMRMPEVPVPANVRRQPARQITMRSLDACVKSLTCKIGVLSRRRLPAKLHADLGLSLGRRHGAQGHRARHKSRGSHSKKRRSNCLHAFLPFFFNVASGLHRPFRSIGCCALAESSLKSGKFRDAPPNAYFVPAAGKNVCKNRKNLPGSFEQRAAASSTA